MATQFSSAISRQLWIGTAYSVTVDCLVAYLVARAFVQSSADALVGAIFIVLAAYAFLLIYSILGAAKYAALFFAYDRHRRVEGTVDQFVLVKMPMPAGYYSDPTAYLTEVALSDDANKTARLVAGSHVGSIEALRAGNHPLLTIFAMSVLEQAISVYSRRPAGWNTIEDMERRIERELLIEMDDLNPRGN